ncbi:MAG: ATP-binding protein [Maledivibacter sp.]|jgi:AAA15 family ATPase/GTPase|nr:ATP-binding protein [Maledivibacter sp.]
MLKLFETTGFKNFEKTVTLDFSDVRDYKFNKECVRNNLLNTIIIYGKNAIGKSNLGLALFDIVTHLTSKNITPGLYDYYINTNNTSNYAEFRYVFQFGMDEVDYRYRKNENQILTYEYLALNSKTLLEYDNLSNSGNVEELKAFAPTLNWVFQSEDSILKYFLYNSVLDDKHPLRQMMKFVSNMLWFRSLDENRYIGYKSKSNDYYDFILDSNNLDELKDFFHRAGIEENLILKEDNDGKTRLYFDTKTPLPFFKVASSGTKALYTFFYWYKTATDISLLYIDEFDSFYHYELSESIVMMLKNISRFQTILTSHNTNLLSNRIMRPDCYLILTQNKLTSLANATDRELREGHNLEKLYMSGEFDE